LLRFTACPVTCATVYCQPGSECVQNSNTCEFKCGKKWYEIKCM